ncbi:SusC/RagA family TonB-linked outer membrane protein [Yeosuana aromativorans]|uniref:SusC/RagA family TonB-linked outer membrane protein n=1 Tax=Yeosuana aromativorans TaxID=288019 RepID=A0A8J3FDP8_9FLAO|nr:TonB-dependent receptor [Yeosuana aromativorans]GGK12211.1 SusC/RagA family TonB-linked outer membrane protein [Yeosuana aromativorans]
MKIRLLIYLLLFGSFLSVTAQEIEVKGVITSSEDGFPLPGASVIVSGTTKGAVSDFDGNYVLEGVDSNATLVFSYVGYRTQEVQVNGQTTIDIAMETDTAQLEAVVLTGYTKERKVDVTGAVTVVDFKPLQGQSLSTGNPMQALQGRVPGLFVEKSGDPTGTNSRILIRGVSTLGNNDPLYVIDGIPTVRQEVFSSISGTTIESIQVLKDASASSIYGSRAANGVIIVTTKGSTRSEDQKLSISYNSSFSAQSEKKQRYKMLNAQQRGEVLWRASVNDGADPNGGYGEIYNFDWNGDYNNPVLNSVTVQPFVGGDPNVPAGDTDWQDATYETGYVFNNELTVSGGTDKAFTLFNVGYIKNTGMLKYTNYERYSARLNSSYKLFNDKVRTGINTQFSNSNELLASPDVGSAPTPGLAITLAPTIPVYDSNGNFAGPIGSGYSDRNNPVLMQYLNRWDNTNRLSFFGNIFAEVDLMENLTFRTSIGIDYNNFERKDIETTVNNGFITRSNNSLTFDTNKYTSLTFSNTLNYNVEFGEHKIGVLLGTESIKTDFKSLLASADGFAVETESYFTLAAASGARSSNGTSSGSRLLSQFGKINYAYSDKYLATFTLRRDGSSRFGADNRYGIFPAATVGWRINNEDFLKDNDFISNLKLRAGYGEVGNQSIGDVARFGLYESRYGPNQNVYVPDFFNIYYNVGTAYDLNGANTGNLPSGFVSIQAANSGLKWESTKEVNLGVDFGFMQNKLIGSFDYFTRKTNDILIKPPIASAVGEGQEKFVNGASTSTKGWELSLAYSNTLDNGLYFAVSTNFGAFKDEITDLPEEVRAAYPGTAENSIIGHSQFSIYGYKTDGLFQSQAEVDAHASQVGARPGGIKFVDLNNDGVINSSDRDFLGNTLPDLEYGISIDLKYKDFDLSIFGSGVTGRIGQDPYIFWNNFVQGRENAGPGTLNAWTPQNTNTDIPALSLVNNDTQTSDYLFRNNSYFKLRNLALGYSLPKDLISKWGGMTNCRIYLQGENLFWITPKGYIGSDPERVDVNRIPVPTTLSIGLNLNF